MIPCGIRDKEVTSLAARARPPGADGGRRGRWPPQLAAPSACAWPMARPASSARPAPASSERPDAHRRAQRRSRRARTRIEVGAFPPWDTNAYLVWDGRSPEALILDPGMSSTASLVARAAANGLRVHLIANSHGHIDHIFDNGPLKRATGAPLAIHPDDAYRLTAATTTAWRSSARPRSATCGRASCVEVGTLAFQVLHTPGHTEGSVCLYEPSAPAAARRRRAVRRLLRPDRPARRR